VRSKLAPGGVAVVTCLVLALVAGITACCYCCYKRQRTVHSVVRLQLGSP